MTAAWRTAGSAVNAAARERASAAVTTASPHARGEPEHERAPRRELGRGPVAAAERRADVDLRGHRERVDESESRPHSR